MSVNSDRCHAFILISLLYNYDKYGRRHEKWKMSRFVTLIPKLGHQSNLNISWLLLLLAEVIDFIKLPFRGADHMYMHVCKCFRVCVYVCCAVRDRKWNDWKIYGFVIKSKDNFFFFFLERERELVYCTVAILNSFWKQFCFFMCYIFCSLFKYYCTCSFHFRSSYQLPEKYREQKKMKQWFIHFEKMQIMLTYGQLISIYLFIFK